MQRWQHTKQAAKLVKRTVPYYPKGTWDLNEKAAAAPAVQRPNAPVNWRKLDLPMWKKHMFALREKFPEGFKPLKRLDREKMQEIRNLRAAFPMISNDDMAKRYKVSPENIRHILKSRWSPNEQEDKELQGRWQRRGQRLGAATAPRTTRSLKGRAKRP